MKPPVSPFRVRDAGVLSHYGSFGNRDFGVFLVDGELLCVASSGEGWDHVSVSRKDRCPTWDEMERVKRLFFYPGETAMQLHVPPSDHVSLHPHCLHLWRPIDAEIPRPPAWMVA